MKGYHKIRTIYKRDERGNLLEGQYALDEFEYLKDNKWIFTEKVDGTNIRIMVNGEEITFGGKTDRAQIPATLVTKLNNIFLSISMRQILKEKFKDVSVCLYGEGYGAKIQKGGGNYISDGVDFILFDVKIGTWWLQRKDVEEIAISLGLKVVPVILGNTLEDATTLAKEGFKSCWGNFMAEGLVIKPKVELFSRRGDRIITKIKYKDFNKGEK